VEVRLVKFFMKKSRTKRYKTHKPKHLKKMNLLYINGLVMLKKIKEKSKFQKG